MRSARICLVAGLLALAGFPVVAQPTLAELESRLLGGSWLSTVEGDGRARTLAITSVAQKGDGSFVISGTYSFSDAAKPSPLKDGQIAPASGILVLSFTTGSGAVISADSRPDGTFAGTFKFPNGQVKSVRFEKLAAGATVPASVAASSAFNGKWSGNAFSQIAGCISGAYDLSVKDGVISGTATFHPREGSPRVSSVTGQVGADGGAALALAPQGEQARRSRFQGKFDKDEFKGDDPAVGGGRCAYAVTLKKAG